jgi:hypothetical protein
MAAQTAASPCDKHRPPAKMPGMPHVLKPHPDSPPCPAAAIDVDVARPDAGHLVLTYAVTGRIGDILLPAVTAATRRDLLWQHTCLEAFIGLPGGPYYEFNLSPSTQWQAARFAGYRSGKEIAVEIAAAPIETRLGPERYTLQATLALGHLRVPRDAAWRLGLSAVIEDTNERIWYWALAHAPGKPDFHHADAFALEFPAAAP